MNNSIDASSVSSENIMIFFDGFIKIVKRIFEPLSYLFALIGGWLTLGIVLLIMVEVVLRSVFSESITGLLEIITIILPVIIFSGMAYASFKKAHIRVGVLTDKLSSDTQLVLESGVMLFSTVIVFITAWQLAELGVYMNNASLNSGYLALPTWPSIMVCAVLMMVFAFALLVEFFEALKKIIAASFRLIMQSMISMAVALLVFAICYFPELSPVELSETQSGVLFTVILFVFIFLGVPIGAAMATTTILGFSIVTGSAETSLSMLSIVGKAVSTNFLWVVLPLFMMLGSIVGVAGFGTDLYNTAYRWIGNIKGGLASATLAACAIFAAVVGESMSGLITMGKIAIPEMRRLKYDTKLALGAIGVGSSLGILIPPSIGFIVYGLLVEQSIGKLFVAGIIPGLIATALMIAMVTFRCWRNPALGPASGIRYGLLEKMKGLKSSWSVLMLLFIILGGIWLGIFTPIEAGAVGSFFGLTLALFRKRIKSLALLNKTLVETVQLSSVIFFIFIFATGYTRFLTITSLPETLVGLIADLELNRYTILVIVLFAYLFLGCVMNALPVLVVTLPIVYPIVMDLGFDPIWFGVLIVIMVEIAQLTPPIGMSVFAMRVIAGNDVSLSTIFAGVVPFWMMLVVTVVIVVIFPQTCLYLVGFMGN